jgi:hypothetical protein
MSRPVGGHYATLDAITGCKDKAFSLNNQEIPKIFIYSSIQLGQEGF